MKFNEVIQNIDVWSTWVDSYKKYVPRFIEEAKTKNNWQDWDKEVFREYFEQSRDQCVSSLQQGYYTNIEKDVIKKNWGEFAVLLKKIANQQDQIDLVTYDEIKKWLRKHTSQNRKAAANRLIASLQPNLLCTIVNEGSLRILMQKINNLDSEANLKITWNWFENSNTVLNYFRSKVAHGSVYEIMTYPWQTFEVLTQKEINLNSNEMSEIENKTSKIKSLLEYKKQIILQGPPGTGKTREAKLIAQEMIDLTPEIIKNKLVAGSKIANASGAKEYYTIKAINDDSVTLISDRTTQDWNPSYKEIIEKYNQLTKEIEPSNKNGMEPYSLAVAKHLNEFKFEELFEDQFKIIQFHPSYTYEDFVRGIVAESKGDKIEYKNVNKTLGEFAERALKNKLDSEKDVSQLSKEMWLDEQFDKFVDYISEEIEEKEEIKLTKSVYIINTDEDAFRYKGKKGWSENGNRMLFKDIKTAFLDENVVRQDIKKNKNLSGLAHHHASYYIRVLDMFREFLKTENLNFYQSNTIKKELKNYVLIIDEINRANLSSVLGELIYALEYRGEAVESMYAIDNDNQLILPPNLYIIGTMNTADRSVGHIDYAIRRRFAFVDVLPENLKEKQGLEEFHEALFMAVENLFNEHTSPEFEVKDVQLGHSYFIDKSNEENGAGMDIRFEYEIKPILLEYVKDGVLIGKGKDIKKEIEELKTLL